MSAAEDFAQYKLQFVDYIQHDYEVIRPIVLFAETIAERSRQTGIERTSVGDKARRFVMEGMLRAGGSSRGAGGPEGPCLSRGRGRLHALCETTLSAYPRPRSGPDPPAEIWLYTNHHTVHRFSSAMPCQSNWSYQMPVFAAFAEAYQARWTVVRMWYEGWNKHSIAGCLKLSRTHVYTILDAFERDGFADPRSIGRGPLTSGQSADPPLSQSGVGYPAGVSPCRTLSGPGLARNSAARSHPQVRRPSAARWRAIANSTAPQGRGPVRVRQAEPATTFKHLPYRPRYRHHMWFVDIRYLVKLADGWVYSLCMLEGYSRKISPGWPRPIQDLTAVLQLLFAALADMGAQRCDFRSWRRLPSPRFTGDPPGVGD